MKDKMYMIDGEPASAEDIITMARNYDSNYDESGFYQTSVGAGILRKHGHTVSKNINYLK
ncbi:MAG: hypothetical protein WC810_14400 [Janthinobacterium sp.]|jgi:hypothetical protein